LDEGQGPTPIAEGKVNLEGATPASARSIVIYRGPVILAQFRLQNGCDLICAHAPNGPHLFETVASVPDEFTLQGKTYRSTGTPDLVKVSNIASGVLLDWIWKTGPEDKWEIHRSALVKPRVPVEIEYAAEIAAPSSMPPELLDEVIRTGRFCGTRMAYPVSAPSTYFDKTGHRVPPHILVDCVAKVPNENEPLHGKDAELGDGLTHYKVHSDLQNLQVKDHRSANYSAIYASFVKQNGRGVAKCRVTITGQKQYFPLFPAALELQ
jgi:hypothetical protein